MKAKSWKNLVRKKRQEEGRPWQEQQENPVAPDAGWDEAPAEQEEAADGIPTLESIAGDNPDLRDLLDERQALEQKMSHLLGGGDPLQNPASDPRFAGSEIPSIRQKQVIDQRWEQARKRASERLKKAEEQVSNWTQKRDSKGVAGSHEAPAAAVNDSRFLRKIQQEQERFSSPEGSKSTQATDRLSPKGAGKQNQEEVKRLMEGDDLRQRDKARDSGRLSTTDPASSSPANAKAEEKAWEAKRERQKQRGQKALNTLSDIGRGLKKAGDAIDKFGDSMADLDRKLDEARAKAAEARKAQGMDDDMGSSFEDSDSLFAKKDALKDTLRSNPLVQGYEKLREKQKEAVETKKQYEGLVKKALSVDVGNMEDLAAKADALRQKALEKRRQQQAEEKKEEERRERQRQKKKERF